MYYFFYADPAIFPAKIGEAVKCERVDDVYLCSANISDQITLCCNASGNPSPTVTFYPPSIDTTDNNIIIDSISMDHAGYYSCTASQSVPGLDNIVRQFILSVEGEWSNSC